MEAHPVVPIQVFRHLGRTDGHAAGAGAGAGAGEEEAETAAAALDDGVDGTGATHLVQMIDVLVIKIVETDEEICVMTVPEDVMVAVTGQSVVVA